MGFQMNKAFRHMPSALASHAHDQAGRPELGAAYGKAFQIQTSNDGTTWTTIYSTTTGTGGIQTLPVTGTGRYVRMSGAQRATGYGYSLWEFQVYST